jgi:hypothetical protein
MSTDLQISPPVVDNDLNERTSLAKRSHDQVKKPADMEPMAKKQFQPQPVTVIGKFVGDGLFNEEWKVRDKYDTVYCTFKPVGEYLTLTQDCSCLSPQLPTDVKLRGAFHHLKGSMMTLNPLGCQRGVQLLLRELEFGLKNPESDLPPKESPTFRYMYDCDHNFGKMFKNCTWQADGRHFVSYGPKLYKPGKKFLLAKDLSHIDERLVIGLGIEEIHVADNFAWMKLILPSKDEIVFTLRSYSFRPYGTSV